MLASEEGYVEVVEALLSRDAQVNIQNSVRNVFVHSFISLEFIGVRLVQFTYGHCLNIRCDVYRMGRQRF